MHIANQYSQRLAQNVNKEFGIKTLIFSLVIRQNQVLYVLLSLFAGQIHIIPITRTVFTSPLESSVILSHKNHSITQAIKSAVLWAKIISI